MPDANSVTSASAHPMDAAREPDYFATHLRVSREALLTPLDGTLPTGLPLRGTTAWRAIGHARQSDDPSLPMGAWAQELKRTDWSRVSHMIVNALNVVGKDMQLAAWLVESELHERGLAALAPCFGLIHDLCERWWVELHPQAVDGEFEARANVVRWLNEKLITTVSLVPLVDNEEQRATWSDWERAHFYERLRGVHGDVPDEARDALTLSELRQIVEGSRSDDLQTKQEQLAAGRIAIEGLQTLLRAHLGNDAPSLGRIDDLLARMEAPFKAELMRRGKSTPVTDAPLAMAADDDGHEPEGDVVDDDDGSADINSTAERARAYRALAEIADYLMHIEPHSPVPYLVRRAVEWGHLNAAELYQEMYVRSGGRIEMADLFGSDGDRQGE
ncbi:type VI secretion system ImpA family protein [Luteibacter sp. Sphag1AF]|uniref:type VI secretion system protein TssA n=1 Tax=Luteibacter sp. Sphag1AF TaxID=2587031 RepID=UPI001617A241|nr:type VI secretion system protein TssA [Luteibacter sp. Sphag1AF]MBB3228077.1 type VI secretion system ImpA family protein [Luteibacter sp. Sphag1AF]